MPRRPRLQHGVKVFKATIRLERIGARFSCVLSERGLAGLHEAIRRRQLGPARVEDVDGPFEQEHACAEDCQWVA